MVGTAHAQVGRSSARRSAPSGSACRNRPGMRRSAPASHAAYGVPHALAWNIGTIGRMRSLVGVGTTALACPTPIECRNVERCE